MSKITILIADDHTMIRNIWATILNLQENFLVVAECGNGEAAIEKATALHPDVILMDINLPGINGIEATKLIRKFSPGSKIIGISVHTQPAYVRKMMQEGAVGYVTKNSTKDEMMTAILDVIAGKKYICEEIKNTLSDQFRQDSVGKKGISSLSLREVEIITQLKKGLSSKEIAALLFISPKTVEVHRANILKKLQLKNKAALINFVNSHPEFVEG